MSRVYNFGAGPAMLPDSVVEQAQAELPSWQGLGKSVFEVSHRSTAFKALAERSVATLRQLLNIPEEFAVLFLQGGARSQFAMVPMNCLADRPSIDYLETGTWSHYAIEEAKLFADVNVVASSEPEQYTTIPAQSTWQVNTASAYLHYTANETIAGLEFHDVPTVPLPLVSDMSSNLLSKPIDFQRHNLIYACAQKNCGIAGVTIVIVKKSWLQQPVVGTPSMFNYHHHIAQHSMYNTSPTFSWYMTNLVLDWVLAEGGVAEMQRRSQRKSAKLYQLIDASDFYHNAVDKRYRSHMNVTFTLAAEALLPEFLQLAAEAGLTDLKGHRSVGGCRASIYNAMPEQGVDQLVEFMQYFAKAKV